LFKQTTLKKTIHTQTTKTNFIKKEEKFTRKQIEHRTTKSEGQFNYSEISSEYFNMDIDTDSDGYKSDYGEKKYSNSNKRKYSEHWHHSHFLASNCEEIKITRSLDDGLGTLTNESLGHKKINKTEIYSYHDQTNEYPHKQLIITTKQGFDLNEKTNWNSFSEINTKNNTTRVENYGKKDTNEWYEKWFKSKTEDYAFKWGRDTNEEWEEEWKDVFDDKKVKLTNECYKTSKHLDGSQSWFEEWKEKYHTKWIEKTSRKINTKDNDYHQTSWGNILIDSDANKWLEYSYSNHNNNENVHHNYYIN